MEILVKAEIKISKDCQEIILEKPQRASDLLQILELLKNWKNVTIRFKDEEPVQVSCNGSDYSSYKNIEYLNKIN